MNAVVGGTDAACNNITAGSVLPTQQLQVLDHTAAAPTIAPQGAVWLHLQLPVG